MFAALAPDSESSACASDLGSVPSTPRLCGDETVDQHLCEESVATPGLGQDSDTEQFLFRTFETDATLDSDELHIPDAESSKANPDRDQDIDSHQFLFRTSETVAWHATLDSADIQASAPDRDQDSDGEQLLFHPTPCRDQVPTSVVEASQVIADCVQESDSCSLGYGIKNTFVHVGVSEADDNHSGTRMRHSSCPVLRDSRRAALSPISTRNWKASTPDSPPRYHATVCSGLGPLISSDVVEEALGDCTVEDAATVQGLTPIALFPELTNAVGPSTPRGNESFYNGENRHALSLIRTPSRQPRSHIQDVTPPQPQRPDASPAMQSMDQVYAAALAAAWEQFHWMSVPPQSEAAALESELNPQLLPVDLAQDAFADQRKVNLNLSVWLSGTAKGGLRGSNSSTCTPASPQAVSSFGHDAVAYHTGAHAGVHDQQTPSNSMQHSGSRGPRSTPYSRGNADRRSCRRKPLMAGSAMPVMVTLRGLRGDESRLDLETLILSQASHAIGDAAAAAPSFDPPFSVQMVSTGATAHAEIALPPGPRGAVVARHLKKRLHNMAWGGRCLQLHLPGESL